jgi:hypothetical protein
MFFASPCPEQLSVHPMLHAAGAKGQKKKFSECIHLPFACSENFIRRHYVFLMLVIYRVFQKNVYTL